MLLAVAAATDSCVENALELSSHNINVDLLDELSNCDSDPICSNTSLELDPKVTIGLTNIRQHLYCSFTIELSEFENDHKIIVDTIEGNDSEFLTKVESDAPSESNGISIFKDSELKFDKVPTEVNIQILSLKADVNIVFSL